jgi:hypothetical protein
MNKFYTLALVIAALVVAFTSVVKAEEVKATIEVTPAAAKAFAESEAKRQERMNAAAERAGMTFWEARKSDAGKAWAATKWGALQVSRGVTNADGYAAAAIAIPTGYAAGTAFSAAESCAESAASIK